MSSPRSPPQQQQDVTNEVQTEPASRNGSPAATDNGGQMIVVDDEQQDSSSSIASEDEQIHIIDRWAFNFLKAHSTKDPLWTGVKNFNDQLLAMRKEIIKLHHENNALRAEKNKLLGELKKFGINFEAGQIRRHSKQTARKSTRAEVRVASKSNLKRN